MKLEYAFLKEDPNYIIYNDGRLFSIKSGKFIKPSEYTGGYLEYHIYTNGKLFAKSVHRFVAEYFVENKDPINYNEVNHKDENKKNNNADNLEWCDRKYNTHYSRTWEKSAELNQKKVTKCDINTHEIIEIYDSVRKASKANNCTEQNIGQVARGRQKSACGYFWKFIE